MCPIFSYLSDPKECLRHIPVCGSDGATYHNICFFLIQKHEVDDRLRLDHYGPCRDQGVFGQMFYYKSDLSTSLSNNIIYHNIFTMCWILWQEIRSIRFSYSCVLQKMTEGICRARSSAQSSGTRYAATRAKRTPTSVSTMLLGAGTLVLGLTIAGLATRRERGEDDRKTTRRKQTLSKSTTKNRRICFPVQKQVSGIK